MKKVVVLIFALLALATPAMAQDANVPSGVGAQVACGAGECFVPSFTFLGQIQKYSGTGTSGSLFIQGADCCISGDKYTMTVTSGGQKGTVVTTENIGSLGCSTTWSSSSFAGILAVGSAKAQMKITKAGGGLPAGAYLRLSRGSWLQIQGSDSCGF